MLDVTDVVLKSIVVHKVGNKSKDEKLIISESPLEIDDSFITEILNKYFLSSFKGEAFFNLNHQSDINLNEVYSYAKAIFNNTSSFYIESIHLANHLYENATHPKINSGEFYIVLFENISIEGERTQALGLFKSENKETYLRVFQKNKNFEIQSDEGVNINKLDKGCLIFNIEEEQGYKCLIVDALNKQNEAQYWKDEFLNLKP
ncbi:MAG: nucleoid-associated protein, partial [Bacteroidetes bacterium]|nr:nucleoid-associated protein [Bacteroidota bacterium]